LANERVPTLKGKVLPNESTIIVGGKSFDGWESVSITKNLDSIANQFEIQLFDKFEGLRRDWPVRPGVSVKVNIGRERVLTGRIEKLDVSFSDESRSFSISGRSNAGDLVDSGHTGPTEFKSINLLKLAEELVSPFGIRVFASVESKLIEKFAIKPGETVFEALDRAARLQGFFFISTRGGNIRLTRAARARADTALEQDINLLSAQASYDNSKRHNEYIVKAQTSGLDDFFGDDVSTPQGSAKDLGVTRHRPFVLVSEGSAGTEQAETRAQWEASTRLAQAIQINAVVQGWTQKSGELWGINQLIRFKSRMLGLNRELLSTSVSHTENAEAGKTTSLTLTDPKAFSPRPEQNRTESEDIFSGLGANFQ